jgi:hypothetical protein
MHQVLTVNEIKANYPDQWVLVGNPQVSVASLTAGVIISHAKEKRDLIHVGFDWRGMFQTTMTFFTGEIPKGRKFLL